MLRTAAELTELGFAVFMPHPVMPDDEEMYEMLDDLHDFKIDNADIVLIIGEHHGESTLREIEYAKKRGKEIQYAGNTTAILPLP